VVGVYLQDQHTEAPRAYVVLKESINASKATANAIHDWLNTRIVYYKHLRGGIRFTDTIPKSEAGKILRRVLKELAAGRSVDDKKSRL
jgi:4-coumarate--CoA ligase